MAWTERYIAPGGTQTLAASTELDPAGWEDIVDAVSGDRVNVKAGTYSVTSVVNYVASVTAGNTIWFRGYKTTPGDRGYTTTAPVLGVDIPLVQHTGTGYTVADVDYGIWTDIAFNSNISNRPACYIRGQYAQWKRCYFEHLTGQFIAGDAQASSNYQSIADCHFKSLNNTDPVFAYGTQHKWVNRCVFDGGSSVTASSAICSFLNCIFRNQLTTGLNYDGGNGGRAGIVGCTFYNLPRGIYMDASNVSPMIQSCYFHTITDYAIGSDTADQNAYISDCGYHNVNSELNNIVESFQHNPIRDASDPFTDAAGGDFSLASGNARSVEFLMDGQSTFRDIGGIQREVTAGGGGGNVIVIDD